MKRARGNILVIFVAVVLVVLLMLPLVLQLLQQESKQSVKKLKSTLAFQMAETALAKGVSKLAESRVNWTTAVAGGVIVDYNNDRVFSDVSGGSYKITFEVGSSTGLVRIVGKGRDGSTLEVRTVEAEYAPADPTTAFIASQGYIGMDNQRKLSVHWGALRSYGNCDYDLTRSYPRLISGGYTKRDPDPTPPNTNGVDNWSYQTDLGSAPMPDLAYYKQKAMDSYVPLTSATGEIRRSDGLPVVRNPPNSGYISYTLNPRKTITFDKRAELSNALGNLYEYRCSTAVLYLETSGDWNSPVSIRNAFLDVEAVIAPNGDVSLSNNAVTFHVFGATIPVGADLEYRGTTVWQAGYPTGAAVWAATFATPYSLPGRVYNVANVQIHGYFYSLKHDWGTSSKVVGVVQSKLASSAFRDDEQVYFDPAVLRKIVWTSAPMHLMSWKETSRSW